LTDPSAVNDLVRAFCPTEIYYLAAHHRSSDARCPDPGVDWTLSYETNASGVLHFLEALRKSAPAGKLFYASSSLIFGPHPCETPQTELTAPSPADPYGATKALGGSMCEDYRKRYGIFASVGILYNHESELRGEEFLTAKIIRAALSAQRDDSTAIRIGDLNATVDWGYAPDFVEAFTRILSLGEPDTYVVATGTPHTVRDFANAAFGHLGLDWSRHIQQDPSVLTRTSVGRVGNPEKLMRHTGWRPTVTFPQMVSRIVDALKVEV